MNKENMERIPLCLGVLAHVDAGKTTLSEAILYESGVLRKLGRVDKQDSFLDTYELEKKRGITIFSKQAIFPMEKFIVTLLDTPGHMDFGAEMERTLQVLDYAILVINGIEGVQAHTLTLWRMLALYEIPVFLFVNKTDQLHRSREELMEEIQKKLSEGCVEFREECDQQFYENIAICGEDFLEEFYQSGKISREHIKDGITKRRIFPVCFGSALHLEGIGYFLKIIETYIRAPFYGETFSARVFKVSRDLEGNRLTHLKITGGNLTVKEEFEGEKINEIRYYSGEKYENVKTVQSGRICAVTGLFKKLPGDTLGREEKKWIPILEPVQNFRVVLPKDWSATQFLPKIRQLEEEEPALRVMYEERTKEILIQLMGTVQIEIVKQILWERFHVAIDLEPGQIIYKETIANVVEGVGHFEPLRHYAEVHFLLEPLDVGCGLEFACNCSEDSLSRNWQRLILTHLKEKEHKGVLTGSHITDMRITLVAGKAHEKHTEGGDFRQAVYRGVRQGLMEAKSVLLEPWYHIRIEIPETFVGRAMMDLERRFGKISAPMYEGDLAILEGMAPVSTMQNYVEELRAYSRGMGKISYELKGYYPCHNGEEVIANINYHPEEDWENPVDSIFFKQGSNRIVSWDNVKEYMHIPSVFEKKNQDSINENSKEYTKARRKREETEAIGTEEIDRILKKTSFANQKEKKVYNKKPQAVEQKEYCFTQKEKKKKYLLVDGYNVIFSWKEFKSYVNLGNEEDSMRGMDAARTRLMDLLCNYQAITDYEIILVFDAYRVVGKQETNYSYHNLHVVFTKEAQTADQYIEKFAHENKKDYEITVVTSDGLEQIIIRGQGCYLISSREFEEEIKQKNQSILEKFMEEKEQGRNLFSDAICSRRDLELFDL